MSTGGGVGNTAATALDGVHTLLAGGGGEASSSNNRRFAGDELSLSTIVFSNACISEDNFFGVSRTASTLSGRNVGGTATFKALQRATFKALQRSVL